jgi:peptide/nickel transport system permease protein
MRYRYAISRLVQSLLTFFALITIIFLISRVIGDPARVALGPYATKEQVELMRHILGLDQPLINQYAIFLTNLFTTGKVGMSILTYSEAMGDVLKYFPATLELSTIAFVIGFVGGLLLGSIAAIRQNKIIDQFIRLFSVAGVSVPRFWSGMMLQILLVYLIPILPATGRIELGVSLTRVTGLNLIDSVITGNLPALISSMKCLAMPALVLSTSPMATIARITRASMLDESSKDYVLQAQINGLPKNLITFKYMLKNAFSPILTIAGLTYAWMLGGTFVVESVFSWPGIGNYGGQAALSADMNGIIAVCVLLVTIRLVSNLIVDLSYPLLDPRVTYKKKV